MQFFDKKAKYLFFKDEYWFILYYKCIKDIVWVNMDKLWQK